ncbi:MAG TPA: AmmeMemoRadiSam system protein B, partial [Firmicutes bacterium]|nr:AmmeMemoRadiSam system protein B [Bacillota bacterium]
MGIVWAGIAPHPPIIVPEVGGPEVHKVAATCTAMRQLAADLKAAAPETVVITSPHGLVFRDAVAVSLLPELAGDLAAFGAPGVRVARTNDLELVHAILAECAALKVPTVGLGAEEVRRYEAGRELDHGVLVPFYYLAQAGLTARLVWVGMSFLPPEELYAFGVAVAQAAEQVGRRVAFLASGDLSHRLTREAPAGYHPEAGRFDALLVEKVREGDLEGLLRLDPALAEKAGECGWRSFMMMAGALDGRVVSPTVLSYEGPFGVGYLVAKLAPGDALPELRRLQRLRGARERAVEERRAHESSYVRLARQSLEHYV